MLAAFLVRKRWLHQFGVEGGGRTWARTKDPLIKSQLLYQLSYASPRVPAGLVYGGRTWARTKDPLIKSQLLYQLSYASPHGLRGSRMVDALGLEPRTR